MVLAILFPWEYDVQVTYARMLLLIVQIPKHVPLHVRRKMKDKPPPKYFEVDPPSAILLPGQQMDIRIRFMPSEEVS